MMLRTAFLCLLVCLAAGCSRDPGGLPASHVEEEHAPAPTNRIDVPATVRRNLGITFAKVERRAVARSMRVPGRFEFLPEARREYRTALSGAVELLARQFDGAEPGTLLYRVASPDWRELQQRLAEAEQAIERSRAWTEASFPLLEAHEAHIASAGAAVRQWEERVAQLEAVQQAGGGRNQELGEARAALAASRSELAEANEERARIEARRVEVESELQGAVSRMDLLLLTASTLTGLAVDALREAPGEGAQPRWRSLGAVEVRAAERGVVEAVAVTNGAWVEAGSLVLSTVQPRMLWFRGRGLQSDLGRLRDGLPARVVPPAGGSVGLQDTAEGVLTIGLRADPDERTVELLMTPADPPEWARAGVTAFLEVDTGGVATDELAIPLSAVTRDDLTAVIFRRDPKDPDKVIRVEADLGVDDGRWVVVRSGLREGDEVVLDGVYQLMLAGSGKTAAGHFHADGTFHEGKD